MKKILIISLGALFILVLLAIWAYLFFMGTPESAEEAFADLPLTGTDEAPTPESTSSQENTTPEPTDTTTPRNEPALDQITTVPVAGFRAVGSSGTTTASSSKNILYVAQGTGHIYQYNLRTKQRTRLSNTTVAGTRRAVIDETGSNAFLKTPRALHRIDLTATSSDNTVLTSRVVENLHIDNGIVYYTRTNENGTTAFAYTLAQESTTPLFTVPLQDIRVLWRPFNTDTHYVYNAPTETLFSYLYRVDGTTLRRTPISGYGLEVVPGLTPNSFAFSTQPEDETLTTIYYQNERITRLSGRIIHQKCDTEADTMVCGFSLQDTTPVTDWYKGTHSFNDALWKINPTVGSSELIVNLERESFRSIDVTDLSLAFGAEYAIFLNDVDGYLLSYKLN
jgi:hypothetical protein